MKIRNIDRVSATMVVEWDDVLFTTIPLPDEETQKSKEAIVAYIETFRPIKNPVSSLIRQIVEYNSDIGVGGGTASRDAMEEVEDINLGKTS